MTNEPVHEIFNNVASATSKAWDQPAHTRSLIRAFASRLSILWLLSLQYIQPALSHNWSRKPILGLFESGRFTQVLL